MSNAKKAKELRDKQTKENEAHTKTAVASKAQTEIQADSIAKVQEELENAKLLLSDTNEAKAELEEELEAVKKSNSELKALVAEKEKQIDNLKAANEKATKEIEALKPKKK